LSIKQLRIVDALIRDGSLSRVAKQMGMTQQAVSANLASLRDIFRDPLFVRTGRGVMPTTLTMEIGSEIKAILHSLDRLVERAPFDPAQVEATIVISAADVAHHTVVIPRLREIRARAPHLKIVMSEIEIVSIEAKMAAGEIDIVVAIPEYVPPAWPRRLLYHEHFVAVAAPGSPLIGANVSLELLAQQPFVVVSHQRANLIGSADEWFEGLGFQREVVLSVPHSLLVAEVIEAAEAVAFVPSRLLPSSRLVKLQIHGDARPPGFDMIVAWHPRSDSSPLTRWVVEILCAYQEEP
jgi:DNA-binding transcriptional LysR family regulator